jgi:hypothetical protein
LPSLKYQLSARCTHFAPNPQYEEISKVNCIKLEKKLDRFKQLIKQLSRKKMTSLKSIGRENSSQKRSKSLKRNASLISKKK